MRRWTGRPAHRRADVSVETARQAPMEAVTWADGAVTLVRRAALDDVGRFDERFFLYSEELEWQLRARDHGWSVVLVPQAVAWQEPGQAPPYLETRNRVLMFRIRREWPLVAVALLAALVEAARAAKKRRWQFVGIRLLAAVHGLTGRLDRSRALLR